MRDRDRPVAGLARAGRLPRRIVDRVHEVALMRTAALVEVRLRFLQVALLPVREVRGLHDLAALDEEVALRRVELEAAEVAGVGVGHRGAEAVRVDDVELERGRPVEHLVGRRAHVARDVFDRDGKNLP